MSSGNVVLLEGNRRSGKSSILRHLEGTTAIPGWLGVYCSLQGAEGSSAGSGVPTAEVFRGIAAEIASALIRLKIETPLPNGGVVPAGRPIIESRHACTEGISEAAPFTDLRDYLEVVLEILKTRKLGIVLMLDEFEPVASVQVACLMIRVASGRVDRARRTGIRLPAKAMGDPDLQSLRL